MRCPCAGAQLSSSADLARAVRSQLGSSFVRSQLPARLWAKLVSGGPDGMVCLIRPLILQVRPGLLTGRPGAGKVSTERKGSRSLEAQPQHSQGNVWLHFIEKLKSKIGRRKER